MPKKCINCGANLHGNICEYCGTEYNDNGISATFNEDEYTGELKIGNEIIKVYISQTIIRSPDISAYRDAKGKLHSVITPGKRKFIMIEF